MDQTTVPDPDAVLIALAERLGTDVPMLFAISLGTVDATLGIVVVNPAVRPSGGEYPAMTLDEYVDLRGTRR